MENSSSSCECHDEQHREKNVYHKHIEYECIHEDSTRHKLHQSVH
jgi:hypothetical protein